MFGPGAAIRAVSGLFCYYVEVVGRIVCRMMWVCCMRAEESMFFIRDSFPGHTLDKLASAANMRVAEGAFRRVSTTWCETV